MAQILVRGLDDDVVERLRRRAKRDGRSLQSQVKVILEQAANAPMVDMEAARKLCEEFGRRFKGRTFTDSVELIRKDRDR